MSGMDQQLDEHAPRSLGGFRAVRARCFVPTDRLDRDCALNEISQDVPTLAVQFGDGTRMVVEHTDLWWFDD